MNAYMKNLEYYKDFDLTRIGEFYTVVRTDIPREKMTDNVADLFSFCDDSGTDVIRYMDIEKNDLWEYAKYFEFDGAERAFALEDLLKDSKHYLVYLKGCRWNGTSGYKIFDSIEEVLDRGYDVSIYPRAISRGGKTLLCTESSHDVPTGHDAVIIALSDKEYEYLEHWDRSWEDIEDFVAGCAENAKEVA